MYDSLIFKYIFNNVKDLNSGCSGFNKIMPRVQQDFPKSATFPIFVFVGIGGLTSWIWDPKHVPTNWLNNV